MNHVVLLGDSIFDNAAYVPGGPSVIEHVRRRLPEGWEASLLAVDGAIAEDVPRQLRELPADATHLVVSAGGNNALCNAGLVLDETETSLAELMSKFDVVRREFQKEYRQMLREVLTYGRPTAVCTIYEDIPGLQAAEHSGLALFNELILKEAVRRRVPVIDLRLICTEASDYASTSPIEPSAAGGGKIAAAIVRLLTQHDFGASETRIYI